MGNVYTMEEFENLLEIAKKKQITVLVDEAYHYFYPETFLKYALEGEHIFVTRTFSKLFSLAGCRLGYVAGWPGGIKVVQKLCTPHNTNAFALKFASELLKNPDIIESLIADYKEGRAYLIQELERNQYTYQGEAGNFLFIQPKTDVQMIVEKMKEKKKILIKKYLDVGKLGDCLRVTIGGRKYMEQFMEALLEIDL